MASKLEALKTGVALDESKGSMVPANLYRKDGKIVIEMDENQPWHMLREKTGLFVYFRTDPATAGISFTFTDMDGKKVKIPVKGATGGNLLLAYEKHEIVQRRTEVPAIPAPAKA